MTTATDIMTALSLGLSKTIDNVIPGTSDPLEQAEISPMDLERLHPEMAKVWNGTDAHSMVIRLAEGADFQVQIIRVPPQMMQRRGPNGAG